MTARVSSRSASFGSSTPENRASEDSPIVRFAFSQLVLEDGTAIPEVKRPSPTLPVQVTGPSLVAHETI